MALQSVPATLRRLALAPARSLTAIRTGIDAIDTALGGLPCGAITELYGAASSGRMSLALAMAAAVTRQQRLCAWVDTRNMLDIASAEAAGILLPQLLWVRCGHDLPRALKCTDLLVHAGGFGMVVLDLDGIARGVLQRMPLAYWYRFRRAVQDTPTAFVALSGGEPQTRSCSTLAIEVKQHGVTWCGDRRGACLLREVEYQVIPRKPMGTPAGSVRVRAVA